MKTKSLLLTLFFISALAAQTPVVKLGIEVLRNNNFDLLNGKKVGLITNPTGVDSKLKSTVDILFEAKNVKLIALYGPEHGVRGNFSAGDLVDNYVDEYTKVPVYSLYGKTRKPTPAMLKDVDVLIYDIQDIGCRSYTYISTMGLAIEAAAENGIELIVLDRPNPLGGEKVEGNLVEDGFISFVSQFKIPYVYGLTCGELAKLLNDENMLGKTKCNLTVVPMEGWKREMKFEETGLQWVPASPHVPHKDSPVYYVATGILGELGVCSEGVGYTLPFQLLGAEWINSEEMAENMNALGLEGVIFRPISFKPYYGRDAKKELGGVQIHITDYKKVNLMSIQFLFLQENHKLYPDSNPFANTNRFLMLDKVTGSDTVRKLFTKNYIYNDIKNFLMKDVDAFKELSKKYYIY
ncbi:MAG: DUF1343 domain-containing protein [Ignavibacteriaceae bacterium]|nr:DUF1343 domain-containing protein [Ignavibacteriaceae bacterium]